MANSPGSVAGGKIMGIDLWGGGATDPTSPVADNYIKRIDALLSTHGYFDPMGDAVEMGGRSQAPRSSASPSFAAGWAGRA